MSLSLSFHSSLNTLFLALSFQLPLFLFWSEVAHRDVRVFVVALCCSVLVGAVCVCVSVGDVSILCFAEEKHAVCACRTFPCVLSKRSRVCRQNDRVSCIFPNVLTVCCETFFGGQVFWLTVSMFPVVQALSVNRLKRKTNTAFLKRSFRNAAKEEEWASVETRSELENENEAVGSKRESEHKEM